MENPVNTTAKNAQNRKCVKSSGELGSKAKIFNRYSGVDPDRVVYIDDICAAAKGFEKAALRTMKAEDKRAAENGKENGNG
jgi:hypothetical protein